MTKPIKKSTKSPAKKPAKAKKAAPKAPAALDKVRARYIAEHMSHMTAQEMAEELGMDQGEVARHAESMTPKTPDRIADMRVTGEVSGEPVAGVVAMSPRAASAEPAATPTRQEYLERNASTIWRFDPDAPVR